MKRDPIDFDLLEELLTFNPPIETVQMVAQYCRTDSVLREAFKSYIVDAVGLTYRELIDMDFTEEEAKEYAGQSIAIVEIKGRKCTTFGQCRMIYQRFITYYSILCDFDIKVQIPIWNHKKTKVIEYFYATMIFEIEDDEEDNADLN